jgi:hypothetical protein
MSLPHVAAVAGSSLSPWPRRHMGSPSCLSVWHGRLSAERHSRRSGLRKAGRNSFRLVNGDPALTEVETMPRHDGKSTRLSIDWCADRVAARRVWLHGCYLHPRWSSWVHVSWPYHWPTWQGGIPPHRIFLHIDRTGFHRPRQLRPSNDMRADPGWIWVWPFDRGGSSSPGGAAPEITAIRTGYSHSTVHRRRHLSRSSTIVLLGCPDVVAKSLLAGWRGCLGPTSWQFLHAACYVAKAGSNRRKYGGAPAPAL